MRKKRKNANKRLHKLLFIVFISVIVPNLLAIECNAQENAEEAVSSQVSDILDDFRGAVGDEHSEFADITEVSESVGVKNIIRDIIGVIQGKGGELASFLLSLLGISLMSSLASQAKGELALVASRAVGIVSSLMLFERLMFLVSGTVESLREINSIFGAVIPITVAVNSLGTSPATASTQAIGMGVTLGAYSYVSSEMLGAIVSVIFVCSAASAIDPLFGRLSRSVKNIFLTVMGVFTALVGAAFSLQSTISASADSAVLRGARYAVSSTVPIVGNAVSGVLGVALGGVSYARGIVGGGSIAVILSLMLSPLVTLLAYRLCLKAGMFFSSVGSLDGCEGVLSPFLGAIDALVAVYSLTCVIYIGELAAFLKGGVSLA